MKFHFCIKIFCAYFTRCVDRFPAFEISEKREIIWGLCVALPAILLEKFGKNEPSGTSVRTKKLRTKKTKKGRAGAPIKPKKKLSEGKNCWSVNRRKTTPSPIVVIGRYRSERQKWNFWTNVQKYVGYRGT
jgi:hypothetical protein